MRCPKFRNYDVSPGTNRKRGVKSRVKKLSVTRDQNSIFFLKVDPIPFLGLDLIDARSSCSIKLTPLENLCILAILYTSQKAIQGCMLSSVYLLKLSFFLGISRVHLLKLSIHS